MLRDGLMSLMKSISYIRQSNLLLHLIQSFYSLSFLLDVNQVESGSFNFKKMSQIWSVLSNCFMARFLVFIRILNFSTKKDFLQKYANQVMCNGLGIFHKQATEFQLFLSTSWKRR